MNRQNRNRSLIVGLAVILVHLPIEAGEFGSHRTRGVPLDLAQIFEEAARRYEIDVRLLVAVARRESDFRRTEVSPVGARGVMQLMQATAEWLGVRDSFDPRQNIFAGARYLKMLDQMFDGDLDLMLAAYNAGPGAVRKHHGVPPYRETRAYVASIRNELDSVGQ
ncbi:MAG TPA: lytic transglycosylase domain-containing protein [Thermoanaerobaculia bacterium]